MIDIESNEPHMYLTAPMADNKRQKDPPHLYMSWSLHPDSAPWSELRAFAVPNRDDFLPQDVLCHCGMWHSKFVAIVSGVCYHFVR